MSVSDAVAKGAAWMDDAYPGWVGEVDLGSLNMRLSNADIHWQVTGIDIFDAMVAAGELTSEYWDNGMQEWAGEHGFLFNDDRATRPEAWEELTEAWRQEVRQRLQSTQPGSADPSSSD